MALPKKEDLVELYYEKNHSLQMIAEHYNKTIGSVHYWFTKYNIERRSWKDAANLRDKLKRRNYGFLFDRSPAEHPNWKGGRRISSGGYVELRIPEHPRSRQNGYVFEHLVVYEKHCGTVPKKWHIHHINGNKQDNRIENLMAMTHKNHNIVLPDLIKENQQLKDKIELMEIEIKKLRIHSC